jgi:glycosyltransferase involved in cell wall biosynthesis
LESKLINLTAPINNLGYGVAGYNIFKELYNDHPSAALYPVSTPEFTDDVINAGLKNRGTLKGSPSVKIWHQNDVHSHVGNGQHIGFPIFELTDFNDEEKLSMKHCDKIFVCSEWAKSVLYNQESWTSPPVHVVPLGVDTSLFHPQKSSRPQTIFFNCGKWEKRKGHDILLECFNSAFEDRDNVELWMMCENPFIGQANEGWANLYKSSKLGHKIRLIPRQQTHKDVYNIMRQTDCGVFPARAEGWNLELLEMMACGKSVITTNYSAHTEFCNVDNSLLVEPEGLERACDGVFFSGEYGMWAKLDTETAKEQLISHMRSIHTKKMTGSLDINRAGIDTANTFTWKNSTQRLIHGIEF